MGNGLGFDTKDGFNTGVVLSDQSNEDTDDAAKHHRMHDAHINIDESLADGCVATNPKETCADEGGVSQGHGRVFAVLEERHGEHTGNGGDVSNEAQKDWHHDVIRAKIVRTRNDHRCDD